MSSDKPNNLIHESSPYLLQHAYNPVQWEAWNEKTLRKAKESGKLMIISIGYAACHWCHVMEHECFEDSEVAEVMNTRFIPVKVDREERPDVDQIYMDALQIMTGSGGWPLNIVALPDGRPFWGATYVRKPDWIRILSQLSKLYREDPEKVHEYASDLTGALQRINEVSAAGQSGSQLDREAISDLLQSWKGRFDPQYGGNRGAPKFMMPVSLELLLHWGFRFGDSEITGHVKRTLSAMAEGGLYDQLGGGFSRYSVDERWHIPHFEKMLYDNAQLLSLYARAYAAFGIQGYKSIVSQTTAFLNRELRSEEGGYQASLDADSLNPEGIPEEGAFYVWTLEELRGILKKDLDWFSVYYNLNSKGLWEDGKYVLCRSSPDKEVATAHNMDLREFRERKEKIRNTLLEIRNKRPRPGLDHKIITSWNGLLLSGLADSFRYCGLKDSLQAATALAEFIKTRLSRPDGGLWHTLPGDNASINGFLEDYATVIQGFIDLYEAGQDPQWMGAARELMEFCITHFSATDSPLLYFVSDLDKPLIRRSTEVNDNVIPASNSIMGKNLFRLGLFYGVDPYLVRAEAMLAIMEPSIEKYSSQYSNWMQLALWLGEDFSEVVITGSEAREYLEKIYHHYLPNTLFAVASEASELPLFRNRFKAGETRIFICKKGHCLQPLSEPEAALEILRKPFRP